MVRAHYPLDLGAQTQILVSTQHATFLERTFHRSIQPWRHLGLKDVRSLASQEVEVSGKV